MRALVQVVTSAHVSIDGEVVEGHGVMDESYLTGEPYMMSKTPGATVLSGAINGESALTIRHHLLRRRPARALESSEQPPT